jgi:hypothetical protein
LINIDILKELEGLNKDYKDLFERIDKTNLVLENVKTNFDQRKFEKLYK